MASNENEDIQYILPGAQNTTTDNIFGKRKTFVGLQKIEWGFLVVSLVNLAVCIGMTGYSLHRIISQGRADSADFILTIMLLVNGVFCLMYIFNGLLREMEFELYVFVGAVLFILGYCILEYSVNSQSRSNIKLARMVIACAVAPVNVGLAIAVAREFGWLEFKIVGASEALQYMYREASRYFSLLKFDFQIMLSFVLLTMRNGVEVTLYEKIIVGVGVPFCLMWCILGYIFVRRELVWGMVLFFVVGLAAPIYIIFDVVKVFQHLHDLKSTDAKLLVYSTFSAGAMGIFVHGIVYYEAWRVYRNFGKGLQERAFEVEANEKSSLLAVSHRRQSRHGDSA